MMTFWTVEVTTLIAMLIATKTCKVMSGATTELSCLHAKNSADTVPKS